ncbi:MAG: dihydroorotate dehydrogenase-like protein [Rikenellaceae bacterium]|nr:dihydroorotate dehydrogenase-like protein [Rikenellaceae bacterium]
MEKLKTKYLGLDLKNPLIVSSSGLTFSVEKIKRLEESGAGAVVVKSLFEEQINIETTAINYYSDYPEAYDYMSEYARDNSINSHLELIARAKRECSIPIIGSIACITGREWVTFAKRFEDAGADALKLNLFILPLDITKKSDEIEEVYLETIAQVCSHISIPVSVKLGQNFTNIPGFVKEIYYRGAKGVVMFNKFYETDIDIQNLKQVNYDIFSHPSDFHPVLRWLSITSSLVNDLDYSASTGIHDGTNAVKALLAGADTIQVCSVIYKKGLSVIKDILEFIDSWMTEHNFTDIPDVIGKMNYTNSPNPLAYERTQFMKYYSSHE